MHQQAYYEKTLILNYAKFGNAESKMKIVGKVKPNFRKYPHAILYIFSYRIG